MRFILASFLLFTFPLNASGLDIIAPTFGDLILENGKGPYQTILNEAANRKNILFKERILPQKRALKEFLEKRATCIYAYTAFAVENFGKQNIRASFPLGVFKQYIFTKKGTLPLTRISQLKGHRVAGSIGDDKQSWFENFRGQGIDYIFLPRLEQNIGMLSKGHVDAIVSFMPDLNKYKDQISYDIDKPLFIEFDRLTCHNTPEGNRFIYEISVALKEMYLDGTTKNILGEKYFDFNPANIPLL
ncbi:MAG: transporter substrate-binding domain-containing protein [Sneathiella sp.]